MDSTRNLMELTRKWPEKRISFRKENTRGCGFARLYLFYCYSELIIYIFFNKKYPMSFLILVRICAQSFMFIGQVVLA